MHDPGIKKAIYIFTVAVVSMLLSGCFGGGGGTEEPPVINWDDLIWDDGSNAPNTLWED